jgi:uncharacterized protein YbjT (DUF2867 family)
VPLSPSTGVDLLTGQGLDGALRGADVVVNLTNSPTFDEKSATFFQTTMENMLAAAARDGVRHAVILSIVGVDQVPGLDYYQAKVLQEDILKSGPIPYSIVRATQFVEFVNSILSWTAKDDTVQTLRARGDNREVVVDNEAGMFAAVRGDVLTAPADAALGSLHYRDWLKG